MQLDRFLCRSLYCIDEDLALQRRSYLGLGEVGVALGGADVAVAEHALDDLQRLALLDQLDAAGVAQLVQGFVKQSQSVK
jgi:hypothetical protein